MNLSWKTIGTLLLLVIIVLCFIKAFLWELLIILTIVGVIYLIKRFIIDKQ